MGTVSQLRSEMDRLSASDRFPPIDGGGGGGNNGGMEARVRALEDALVAVRTDLAVVKATHATKSDIEATKKDIAEAKTTIILWVVSAIFLAQLLPSVLKKFGL